jgi:transposase
VIPSTKFSSLYHREIQKKTRCIGNIIGRSRKCKTSVHFDRVIQKKIKVDRRKSASSVKKLNLGRKWVMQHDNGRKHRARIVTNWLNQKGVERLKWPSFSSDLNPIEYIWDEVERRMKKEKPKNETELKQALLRIWHGC